MIDEARDAWLVLQAAAEGYRQNVRWLEWKQGLYDLLSVLVAVWLVVVLWGVKELIAHRDYQVWITTIINVAGTAAAIGVVSLVVMAWRQEWRGKTDRHRQLADQADRQAALVEELAAAVQRHPIAGELLAEGVPEGVIRRDYRGVPCQARFDWLHPDKGLVDLKTCDHLKYLEADARSFGYLHQLAFYRALLALQTGEVLPVHLIAVEKREPYRCGVWRIDPSVLAAAEQDNEAALERLVRCRQLDHWPTGYEELRHFDHL